MRWNAGQRSKAVCDVSELFESEAVLMAGGFGRAHAVSVAVDHNNCLLVLVIEICRLKQACGLLFRKARLSGLKSCPPGAITYKFIKATDVSRVFIVRQCCMNVF